MSIASRLEKITGYSIIQIYEVFVLILVSSMAAPTNLSLSFGIAISLIGACYRVWAAGYGRPSKTFSITGPYRFVRHPYLLGTFFLILGVCIASRSAVTTVLTMGLTILIFRELFNRAEILGNQKSGVEYISYRTQVPSFLPTILPYPAPSDQNNRFSLARALKGTQSRELDTLAMLVVGYCLLYALKEIDNLDLIRLVITAAFVGVVVLKAFLNFRQKKQR